MGLQHCSMNKYQTTPHIPDPKSAATDNIVFMVTNRISSLMQSSFLVHAMPVIDFTILHFNWSPHQENGLPSKERVQKHKQTNCLSPSYPHAHELSHKLLLVEGRGL